MELNGAAIRAIRVRSGMSVTAAAEKAKVSQPTWSNWERGKRRATPENLKVICAVLALDDMTAILASAPEVVA
jgi:transcriptional regulator with XRE-family HTH domain